MQSNRILYKIIPSPIGGFVAAATERGCCLFEFCDRTPEGKDRARVERRLMGKLEEGESEIIDQVEREVGEYFEGRRAHFTLPLDMHGTPFEREVWSELCRIPYGETRSYGEIAARLGKSGAARAVGRANGSNPIPIIVPCHRVIQEGGSLGGYGGGVWRKRWLLHHERTHRPHNVLEQIPQRELEFIA